MTAETIKPSSSPFEKLSALFRKSPVGIDKNHRRLEISNDMAIDLFALPDRSGQPTEYLVESRNSGEGEYTGFCITKDGLKWIQVETDQQVNHVLHVGNIEVNIPVPRSSSSFLCDKVYIPQNLSEEVRQTMAQTLLDWTNKIIKEKQYSPSPVSSTISMVS